MKNVTRSIFYFFVSFCVMNDAFSKEGEGGC